jgi:tetratricopeptide (TPR) repeat protein
VYGSVVETKRSNSISEIISRLEPATGFSTPKRISLRTMRTKKFAAAQIKFEQAIRDNPDFAEAHNNLGFTLRQQGPQSYPKALEHYNKAIQHKPNMGGDI